MLRTISPGTLVVQSAYPDPPFDLMRNGVATGFDIELMRAVCRLLRLELHAVAYEGDNFNDIFDGLIRGTCDAVISGTTITPQRAATVKFSRPYLTFNQGVAVNRRLTPERRVRGRPARPDRGNPVGQHIRFRGAEIPGAAAKSPAYATIPITGSRRRSTISKRDTSA